MIEILPIQAHQVADAKHVIYVVAWRIFRPEITIDEFMAIVNEQHELDDMDNVREIYTENRGLFLVVLDEGKVIGTGAVRKRTDNIAELKRIWLLESYHGQQIGFRVVNLLLDFARQQGYTGVYLETSQRQMRALAFYKRMGFYEVPSPYEEPGGVSMEMLL